MTAAAPHVHVPVSTHLATLFGIGRIPLMPGTIASAAAFPVGWWMGLLFGWMGLLVAGGLMFLLGWYVCGAHAKRVGVKDPAECVLDEVAGQWIALAAIPLINTAMPTVGPFFNPIALAATFVGFRFFDIVKPWPISRLQNLEGGLGIMADDIIAGAVTAVLVFVAAMAKAFG
jgi:phosphatidylglycerophosphatase A